MDTKFKLHLLNESFIQKWYNLMRLGDLKSAYFKLWNYKKFMTFYYLNQNMEDIYTYQWTENNEVW